MSKIHYCLSALDTSREEECSLLILVDAIHFLKHCPLVSVADKHTSIYCHFSLLLELLAFLDQTRGESKCDS
jgi:hypothetical protein